jgi:lysine 6-dehydrogenase
MWEKTLRYPGHADKVKLLKALGFFSPSKINVQGVQVQPRKFTAKILEQKLSNKKPKDIVALKTETTGTKDRKTTKQVYTMLDFSDKKRGVTSMARTTAYPASIVAQMLLNKHLKEKGVVPPEKIGMNNRLFKLFSEGLKSHVINIKEEKSAG